MRPGLSVVGLVKRYGVRPAVDGVDLDVSAGEVVALLGRNGSGKTTTVECIEGFRIPDAGTVRVLGLDPVRDRAAVTAGLGVMLQEGGAYQAATPREMLRLFARLHADPVAPDVLLERLGLTAVADVRHRSLSGGEKQRVNLALALSGRPVALCLDEPTAGMDPEARNGVWQLLREQRDSGVAVLLTTHALDEAERLADVVAILDAGRIVALGSPAQLTAQAAGSGSLLITSPGPVDAAALSAALGASVVRRP